MIGHLDIKPLRTTGLDYKEAEDLKHTFRNIWEVRIPFFLTRDELEKIFRWKLIGQYGRTKALRDTNTEDAYRVVTKAAFEFISQDDDYELEIRSGILTSLRGVGVPVSSAILALVDPDKYCVIDFRGWRQVFGQERTEFSIPDYKKYRSAVRVMAKSLGWSVQETDLAIWEYDRRIHGLKTG